MHQYEFLNRIATDKDLRAQLRRDAKATMERLGVDTGDIQIKVVEDSASVQHFALPANLNEQMGDQDLEKISAGRSSHEWAVALGKAGRTLGVHKWFS